MLNGICSRSAHDRRLFSFTSVARSALLATLLFTSFAWFDAGVAEAQGDAPAAKKTREIFVPYSELEALLDRSARHVLLKRDQYEELIQKAIRLTPDMAPRAATILSASYDGQLSDSRAEVRASLEIEILRDGLIPVSFGLTGFGVRSARIGDAPVPLAEPSPGKFTVFLEGRGRRAVVLDLTAPVVTSAAQQSLSFNLPTVSASQFRLRVPGNVEVKSGASVISRDVDEDANVTTFELTPPRGKAQIVMSLNNKRLQRDQVVVARSVVVDELTQAYERLHVTTSFEVLHGAAEQFRFSTPAGWEITDVRSEQLARWSVAGDENPVLEVTLRRPATGVVTCAITAVRNSPEFAQWTMPELTPLETAGNMAIVGVLLEDRLKLNSVVSADLIPIDAAVLAEALPESATAVAPGEPIVTSALAYYAPLGSVDVTGSFDKPPARLNVVSSTSLKAADGGLTIDGRFVVLPEVERRYSVQLAVPAGWRVTQITDANQAPLRHESYTDDDGAAWESVYFQKGVEPGQEATILFRAERIPDDWFGVWNERELDVPQFALRAADETLGALVVESFDDLQALPIVAEGLTPLNANERSRYGVGDINADLAYRFDGQYRSRIQLRRNLPSITARSFAFHRVESNRLVTHLELIFDVREARTRTLGFSLPIDTPRALAIQGVNVAVKEQQSDDDEDAGLRRWTAQLAERRGGEVRLAVDFETTWEGDPPAELKLPMPAATGSVYQTSIVAVEGDSQLDVEIDTEARRVDVGELVVANYQTGPRLVGAHEFIGASGAVTLKLARRAGKGLPPVIVERAEIVTLFGGNGRAQSAARYYLKTKVSYLEVRLPAAAKLWAVMLDGRPMTPQRDGDRLLLSLPPSELAVRDLSVVYETPTPKISTRGVIQAEPPRLFIALDDDQNKAVEAPLAQLIWHAVLPNQMTISDVHGTVYPVEPLGQSQEMPALFDLADVGGIVQMSADLTQIEYPDDMVAESGGLSHALELPADPFGAPNEPSSGDGEATTAEPTAPPVAAASPQNAVPPPTDQPQPPGAGGEDAGAGDRGPGPGGQQQAARPGDENAQFAELPVTAGWALEGVRSLNIDLTNAMSSAHNVVTFKSLGVSPRLAASVIDRRRLDSLVWGLALVVVACGLCLLRCSGRTQAWFIVLMIALLLFVPPLIDQVEFSRSVVDLIGTVVFLLAVLYIAKAVVSFFVSRLARIASGAAVAATVMLLIASGGQLNAQEMSASELVDLIKRLAPQPVTIPKDAVIVPFRLDPDGDLTDSLAKADQVFVPYEKYVELWNRANPNQKLTSTPPPAEYAFSGAAYTATLADGDEWVVQGTISIDLFVERPILVPLPLQSGVVAAATLDGEPAKLTVIQPAPANAEPKQQDKQAQMEQQAAPAAGGPVLALQVSGKGRKELALTIRFRVNRQGGWRRVGGRLPSAPATSLTLTAPALDTEIRLSGVQDRSQWQTTEANQTIETALATGGQFALQWRPQVAQGVVDQSLTANSQVALHIQEDGLRAVWIANLEFRQGRRTTFSFTIPTDYVIERVEGANIRGWTTEVQDDQRRIEVTLLKEAVDRESVQLQTAKRGAVGVDELREFDGPVVGIPEAALHQGSLIIRRSPHLNLRIANLRGVVQTDIPDNLPAVMSIESGPLGVRDFQAYEFSMTPFQLRLAATPITTSTAKTSARLQTLLRLAADDAALESRILIESPDRSIYRLHVRIPAALDVAQVAAPGLFDWSVTGADDQRTLNLFLNEGQRGSWSVALNGSLGERQGDQPLDIPRLEVLNVRRQEGDIVVQADPGYRVDSSNLNGIQATQLETQASGAAARVQQWLAAKQRTLARLALTYQQPNYSGQLVTTRRNSQITCTTVTNVRVSDQTIEETILLQFKVRHAGVRELTFLAPATLAAARVQAPLLRRKTIEPIEDNEDQIRFRLELQEEVMGDILIVVERDRLHTSDEQFAPLPTIESEFAETLQQYVTLENASRDELVITQNEGVEPLSRQTAPAMLANADLNRAYVVKGAAVFAFQAKRRETVQTVGARIGLSEISLMVDANGAYRGIQTLHIDNRTEQYLEIELPAGAALWTARVAGASVKPAQSAAGAQLFRLPLIKTAAGDPDYSVEIKYGGQLPPIANWRTVKFPLPRTHNINVELSQVRLFLPESFRWDKFGGSLKQVDDAAELDAGYVTYVNRQIEKATQTLLVGSDYDRARATSNLKKLQVLSGQLRDYNKSNLDNENVQEQVDLNAQVLERAERTIREQEYESQELGVDNRIRFNDLFTRQKNERSRNVVESFGNNFSYSESGGKPGTKLPGEGKGGAFDKEWLSRNQLKSDKGSGGKGPAGKADDAKQGASKSRVQTNRKQLGNNREQLEQRLAAPQTKPQKEKSEAERQTRQTEPQRRSQSSKELANEYKMRLDRLSQLGWTSGQAGQQGQSQQGVQSGRRSDVDDRDGSRVSGGGIGGGGGGFGVDGRGRGFGEGAANAEEVPHAIASGVVPDFGEQTTLASLDIDMPMDGESYFFVTPRGELEIEARVIEDRLVDRGIRLILAIVVLLVAGVVMRLTRRRSS